MNKYVLPTILLCLLLFIGCLGTGSSGDPVSQGDISAYDIALSGQVYFPDRQLYGGIPIHISGSTASATIYTDNGGHFAIEELPSGLYDLTAQTGDTEILFKRSVQITEGTSINLEPIPLISLLNFKVSKQKSHSFTLEYEAGTAVRSKIFYTYSQGNEHGEQTLVTSPSKLYSGEISLPYSNTSYDIKLEMSASNGQVLTMRGISVNTANTTGPTNLSAIINRGAFETYSHNVNLYIEATNADYYRIGEDSDLSNSNWTIFRDFASINYTFTNLNEGTKRIYVQFKDKDSNLSPVINDSILLTTEGYIGIWLENGNILTGDTDITLKAVFPDATYMMVSNNINFINSFWEVYKEIQSWKLFPGDGTKTVYVKFKGGSADETKVYTASIELDSTPPVVYMRINNGAEVTGSTTVDLNFITKEEIPKEMKISNEKAPDDSISWIPFKSNFTWFIPDKDGYKHIFAIFRDAANNIYGPIEAQILLDTKAPEGNEAVIKNSLDSNGKAITDTNIDSLPVYLVFNFKDSEVKTVYYTIMEAEDEDDPSLDLFETVEKPFKSVEFKEGKPLCSKYDGKVLAVGKYKVILYFSDEAGNTSYKQTLTLNIDGPKLLITPDSVVLKPKMIQKFKCDFQNVSSADTGEILWNLKPDELNKYPGAVIKTGDLTAEYTSPDFLLDPRKEIINVTCVNNIKYLNPATVTINLQTSPVVMYENQQNTEYQIMDKYYSFKYPKEVVNSSETQKNNIRILHSKEGILIHQKELKGSISLNENLSDDYGVISEITYTPPKNAIDNFSETINFESKQYKDLIGTITYDVTVGTSIKLNITSGIAQHCTDPTYPTALTVSAQVSGSKVDTLNWKLLTTDDGRYLGSLSHDQPDVYKTTTDKDHTVTFYANSIIKSPNEKEKLEVSVTDPITNKEVKTTCVITVLPPVDFKITKFKKEILPKEESTDLVIEGFDKLHPNGNSNVIWTFKLRDEEEYHNAQKGDNLGGCNDTRGYLIQSNEKGSEAIYKRPAKSPMETDPSATSNKVDIKAVSALDNDVIKEIEIDIIENVTVIINTVPELDPKQELKTVLEMGKIQFKADIKPDQIPNKKVKWEIVTPGNNVGTIDETEGLYTAPLNPSQQLEKTEVTIRATSLYDPNKYNEKIITLLNFWQKSNDGMQDQHDQVDMPVSIVKVNPFYNVVNQYSVYAGTSSGLEGSRYGYGLWKTIFYDNAAYDSWKGIEGLYTKSKNYSGKYIIQDLHFVDEKTLYVATGDGLFLCKNDKAMPVNLTVGILNNSTISTENLSVLSIAVDKASPSNNRLVYISTPSYVFRMFIDEAGLKANKIDVILDCVHQHKLMETRFETKEVTDTESGKTTTTQEPHEGLSYENYSNTARGDAIKTLAYDNTLKRLYCGGTEGRVYTILEPYDGNLKFYSSYDVFVTPEKSNYTTNSSNNLYELNDNSLKEDKGSEGPAINKIVQDMQNTATLWKASVDGVSRSVDGGNSWVKVNLEGGSSTNCQTVIIDPTNTTTAMTGTEDGVYKITISNGVISGKRIVSGLESIKLMRSIDQSLGRPGERRRIWLGTSGGVFMGKEPQKLY